MGRLKDKRSRPLDCSVIATRFQLRQSANLRLELSTSIDWLQSTAADQSTPSSQMQMHGNRCVSCKPTLGSKIHTVARQSTVVG